MNDFTIVESSSPFKINDDWRNSLPGLLGSELDSSSSVDIPIIHWGLPSENENCLLEVPTGSTAGFWELHSNDAQVLSNNLNYASQIPDINVELNEYTGDCETAFSGILTNTGVSINFAESYANVENNLTKELVDIISSNCIDNNDIPNGEGSNLCSVEEKQKRPNKLCVSTGLKPQELLSQKAKRGRKKLPASRDSKEKEKQAIPKTCNSHMMLRVRKPINIVKAPMYTVIKPKENKPKMKKVMRRIDRVESQYCDVNKRPATRSYCRISNSGEVILIKKINKKKVKRRKSVAVISGAKQLQISPGNRKKTEPDGDHLKTLMNAKASLYDIEHTIAGWNSGNSKMNESKVFELMERIKTLNQMLKTITSKDSVRTRLQKEAVQTMAEARKLADEFEMIYNKILRPHKKFKVRPNKKPKQNSRNHLLHSQKKTIEYNFQGEEIECTDETVGPAETKKVTIKTSSLRKLPTVKKRPQEKIVPETIKPILKKSRGCAKLKKRLTFSENPIDVIDYRYDLQHTNLKPVTIPQSENSQSVVPSQNSNLETLLLAVDYALHTQEKKESANTDIVESSSEGAIKVKKDVAKRSFSAFTKQKIVKIKTPVALTPIVLNSPSPTGKPQHKAEKISLYEDFISVPSNQTCRDENNVSLCRLNNIENSKTNIGLVTSKEVIISTLGDNSEALSTLPIQLPKIGAKRLVQRSINVGKLKKFRSKDPSEKLSCTKNISQKFDKQKSKSKVCRQTKLQSYRVTKSSEQIVKTNSKTENNMNDSAKDQSVLFLQNEILGSEKNAKPELIIIPESSAEPESSSEANKPLSSNSGPYVCDDSLVKIGSVDAQKCILNDLETFAKPDTPPNEKGTSSSSSLEAKGDLVKILNKDKDLLCVNFNNQINGNKLNGPVRDVCANTSTQNINRVEELKQYENQNVLAEEYVREPTIKNITENGNEISSSKTEIIVERENTQDYKNYKVCGKTFKENTFDDPGGHCNSVRKEKVPDNSAFTNIENVHFANNESELFASSIENIESTCNESLFAINTNEFTSELNVVIEGDNAITLKEGGNSSKCNEGKFVKDQVTQTYNEMQCVQDISNQVVQTEERSTSQLTLIERGCSPMACFVDSNVVKLQDQEGSKCPSLITEVIHKSPIKCQTKSQQKENDGASESRETLNYDTCDFTNTTETSFIGNLCQNVIRASLSNVRCIQLKTEIHFSSDITFLELWTQPEEIEALMVW